MGFNLAVIDTVVKHFCCLHLIMRNDAGVSQKIGNIDPTKHEISKFHFFLLKKSKADKVEKRIHENLCTDEFLE